MSLLSPADQEKLRESFDEMTRPVRLLFFTQALGCETCPETRRFSTSCHCYPTRSRSRTSTFVLEKDRAAQYGIRSRAGDCRHRLKMRRGSRATHGSGFSVRHPGYEFISLVTAVLLVGGRGSMLSDENRERIAAIDKPVTMQVFTTPT